MRHALTIIALVAFLLIGCEARKHADKAAAIPRTVIQPTPASVSKELQGAVPQLNAATGSVNQVIEALDRNPPNLNKAKADAIEARGQIAAAQSIVFKAVEDLKRTQKTAAAATKERDKAIDISGRSTQRLNELEAKWYVRWGRWLEGAFWLFIVVSIIVGISGAFGRVAGPGWYSLPAYWFLFVIKFITTSGIPYLTSWIVGLYRWMRGTKK